MHRRRIVLVASAVAAAGCSALIGIEELPGPVDGGVVDSGAPDVPQVDANGGNDATVDTGPGTDAGSDAADATPDVAVDSCVIGTYDAGGPSGSIDQTFANGTKAGSPAVAPNAVVVDGSGSIYVVGATPAPAVADGGIPFHTAVKKFRQDGTTDGNFGASGVLTFDFGKLADTPTRAAFDPDGNLLIVGQACDSHDCREGTQWATVARVTPGGSLDSTFAGNAGIGRLILSTLGKPNLAFALATDPNRKILVGGSDMSAYSAPTTGFLLRLNKDGTLDTSFSPTNNGLLKDTTVHGFYSVAVDPAGNVVAAGSNRPDTPRNFAVRRFTATGTPDTAFADGGIAQARLSDSGVGIGDEARELFVLPNGQILLGGSWGEPVPATGYSHVGTGTFSASGALDPSYGDGGTARGPLAMYFTLGDTSHAFERQCDGKLLMGGWIDGGISPTFYGQDLAVTRLLSNGAPDLTYGGGNGVATVPRTGHDIVADIAIDPTSGRVVVAGRDSTGTLILYRYNP